MGRNSGKGTPRKVQKDLSWEREAGQQVLKEINDKMRRGKENGWKSMNGPLRGNAPASSGAFSFQEFIRDQGVRAGLTACVLGILIAFFASYIGGSTLRMIAMTMGGCISLTGVSQITRYILEHGGE